MAYTLPTPATFKLRYPEFAGISDASVQLVLDEAIASVGETWLEKDRARAQMLLAAHTLSLMPSINAVAGGTINAGAVKRRKVGDVETEFVGSVGNSTTHAGFGASTYGQEYYRLLRLNFPSPLVV